MNRIINFRFWLSHSKKMTYAHDLQDVGKIIPVFTADIIPLQFTGLSDKDGRGVYEGDIVKADNKKYEVIWNDRNASFALKGDFCYSYFDDDVHVGDIEVIGNVYENHELLNS